MRYVWPVTIVATRYGGVYEGGGWAAFHLEPDDIPAEVLGSDGEAQEWWDAERLAPRAGVAVAGTPDEAYARLRDQLLQDS